MLAGFGVATLTRKTFASDFFKKFEYKSETCFTVIALILIGKKLENKLGIDYDKSKGGIKNEDKDNKGIKTIWIFNLE